MEGTTLNLKKCVRILSLLRHPLCVTVLTVQLELQVMTDLFSMYEVGSLFMNITSLTCKFLQSYTDFWQVFVFSSPFYLDSNIEKCH